VLCSHIYLTVKRRIKNNEQIFEENEEIIKVFEDRITTASEDFKLHDILDISFKNMSGKKGFLYLHTTSGVYSYITNIEPVRLIEVYKELKNQH
jgi:hypothetical protein